LIEQFSPTAGLVYWFSYTPQGEQAWWVGLADIDAQTMTVSEADQPVGGRFGIGYDPATVVRPPWGDFNLVFSDCDSAALNYNSDTFGSGNQSMIRLTTLVEHACSSLP